MKIVENSFSVTSRNRNQMIDITSRVNSIVAESGISNGDVIVFCPHTTAAVTINENADPDVLHDILLTFSGLIPQNCSDYRHCEGNSDAHCKSSIVGCQQQILIKDGRLNLGIWQGIFFCEFDGPRNRKVIAQVRGQ